MDYAKVYSEMHKNPKHFAGHTIKRYTKLIAKLVEEHAPNRLIDYGSGKGYQYLEMRVHEKWGGLLPYCYDVGVRQLATKPEGKFDGLICTDVMEHIEEGDVQIVLRDALSTLNPEGFAFFGVCCRLSGKKFLPDGRDVHVTVKPPKWWDIQFTKAADATGFKGKLSVSYEEVDADHED